MSGDGTTSDDRLCGSDGETKAWEATDESSVNLPLTKYAKGTFSLSDEFREETETTIS